MAHKKQKAETGGANILRFFDKQPEVGRRVRGATEGAIATPPAQPLRGLRSASWLCNQLPLGLFNPNRKECRGTMRQGRGGSRRRWAPPVMAPARPLESRQQRPAARLQRAGPQ